MRLVFLGTSGSVPTPRRNLPAIAIRRKGELIFLDCGEGTQRQMMGASLGFPKTIRIFLSHLHPDHVWGIPGLIHTLTMQDYQGKLQLYGPPGVENYLRSTMKAVNFHPTFPVEVQTIEGEGNILTGEDYRIQSTPADHNIPALAYSLTEKERPGRFDREKAERLGIPEGPLRKQATEGRDHNTAQRQKSKPRRDHRKTTQGEEDHLFRRHPPIPEDSRARKRLRPTDPRGYIRRLHD
jgi:ribonuclease Z